MTLYTQIDRNKRRTFFLVFFFILLILAIAYVYGLFMEEGYFTVIVAAAVVVPLSLIGYYSADKVALFSAGAHSVNRENAKPLYNLVENLCITAGIPVPKIYLIDSPAINAFAVGRDPKHAAIALTRGSATRLTKTELEGVIAHELSHIKNYDTRLMTAVVVFVGLVILLRDLFFRGRFFLGGGRKKDNREGAGNPLGAILLILGLIFILLSPLFAKLIQFAISRQREFLADSSGVLLTRYPQGLIGALKKIETDEYILPRTSDATAHLFIANPFKGGERFHRLFSTHPPILERIQALEKTM